MPNGNNLTIRESATGGRSAVITTDNQLQEGPGVNGIDRIARANNRGKIGNNLSGFPTTGGMNYIGHVPLVHRAQGVNVNVPGNGMDDTTYIPGIMAGNPL